jgi:hypothetical protein
VIDPADVLVVIGHPFGEALPLSVIPLRYRNDEQFRQAIPVEIWIENLPEVGKGQRRGGAPVVALGCR